MAEAKAKSKKEKQQQAPRSKKQRSNSRSVRLTSIGKPQENDVVYGRGGLANHHSGNKRYRKLIQDEKRSYLRCPDRKAKTNYAMNIVHQWRKKSHGRFLQKDENTGLWNDVGDQKARQKTSQLLREGAPELWKQMQVDDTAVVSKKKGNSSEGPKSNPPQTVVAPARKKERCRRAPRTELRSIRAKKRPQLSSELSAKKRKIKVENCEGSPPTQADTRAGNEGDDDDRDVKVAAVKSSLFWVCSFCSSPNLIPDRKQHCPICDSDKDTSNFNDKLKQESEQAKPPEEGKKPSIKIPSSVKAQVPSQSAEKADPCPSELAVRPPSQDDNIIVRNVSDLYNIYTAPDGELLLPFDMSESSAHQYQNKQCNPLFPLVPQLSSLPPLRNPASRASTFSGGSIDPFLISAPDELPPPLLDPTEEQLPTLELNALDTSTFQDPKEEEFSKLNSTTPDTNTDASTSLLDPKEDDFGTLNSTTPDTNTVFGDSSYCLDMYD